MGSDLLERSQPFFMDELSWAWAQTYTAAIFKQVLFFIKSRDIFSRVSSKLKLFFSIVTCKRHSVDLLSSSLELWLYTHSNRARQQEGEMRPKRNWETRGRSCSTEGSFSNRSGRVRPRLGFEWRRFDWDLWTWRACSPSLFCWGENFWEESQLLQLSPLILFRVLSLKCCPRTVLQLRSWFCHNRQSHSHQPV